jgi:N-glycosylase/DNA lyase
VEQTGIKELKLCYNSKKEALRARLNEFKTLNKVEQQKEFMFCTLTPQSNAQRCWSAVEEIFKGRNLTEKAIKETLRTRTRFHNNKTRYILQNKGLWNNIRPLLDNPNIPELRNWLADNVQGYGLKEASHFLRNIGKSNNQIAILDRHILRNLKAFGAVKDDKIMSRKDYLEKEQKYLSFAKQIEIPADELDLLWWSQENGEVFK